MNLTTPAGPRDDASTLVGDRVFLGVDERRPPNQLPEGYVSQAKNLRFRRGKAEPRRGVKICRWMKEDGTTPFNEVYGACVFADPNQAGDWIIIAADGGVWKTRPNMAATEVPLPATVSLTRETFSMFVPCTDAGESVLVLLRGDDHDPLVCTNIDLGFTAVPSVTQTLSSLTSSSTTATATKAAHGYETGQIIVIAGATQTEYNGEYEITVTGTDTFTYTFAGSGTTPATGTITARRSGRRDMPASRFGVNTGNRLLLIEDRDGVAASDLLAYHDFLTLQNEFRINTGQSDRLQRIQPLIGNRLLMFKEQSVLEVQNAGSDLAEAIGPLDVTNKYGLAAPLACVRNGANCYWLTGEPAIASLKLTELNETQDTDLRLSDALSQTFGRINPLYLDRVVMEVWDGKLYCALPLDDPRIPDRATVPFTVVDGYWQATLTPGVLYEWDEGGTDSTLTVGSAVYDASGRFIATNATGRTNVAGEYDYTGSLRAVQPTCNGIAVYDFINQAWCGVDEADDVYAVKAFLKTAYQGRQRLFAIGSDGVLRLLEEGFDDEVYDEEGDIVAQAIRTRMVTRAYQQGDRQRALSAAVLLRTWNPSYTLTLVRQDYGWSSAEQTAVTRDRTKYDQHDQTDYDETNTNDDHGAPGRKDYSVVIPADDFYLGSGVNFDAHQVSTDRVPLSSIGTWFQLQLENIQGRCEVLQCALETQDHERRSGAEII